MTSDAEIVHARNCAMRLIEGPAPCTCRLVERQQAQTITRLSARVEELERALKPFADKAVEMNECAATCGVAHSDHYRSAEYGECELARTLLSEGIRK